MQFNKYTHTHTHTARVTISADSDGTCEHPTAPFVGPVSAQAHRTEGVTGSERQEGANGVGGGNGDDNGVGGGNGDVNGHGDGTERERKREWRWR